MNKYEKFVKWLATSIIIGALPFIVNLIVNWVANQLSFQNIFKVNDLVFFAVIMNTTTILDILTAKSINNNWKMLSQIALLFMIIISILFYGIFSFYTVNPPTANQFAPIYSNLINGCIMIVLCSLLITILIQLGFINKNLD